MAAATAIALEGIRHTLRRLFVDFGLSRTTADGTCLLMRAVSGLDNLEAVHLRMQGCHVPPAAVAVLSRRLARGDKWKTVELRFAFCSLGDDGIEALTHYHRLNTSMGPATGRLFVDLRGNNLTDASVVGLAALSGAEWLRSSRLMLTGNHVSGDGAERLLRHVQGRERPPTTSTLEMCMEGGQDGFPGAVGGPMS